MIVRAILASALSAAVAVGALYLTGSVFDIAPAVSTAQTNINEAAEGANAELAAGLEAQTELAQGMWTSVNDPDAQLQIEGAVYREYYQQGLILERRIEWQLGCEGSATETPSFITFNEAGERAESCTYLVNAGPDEMGFAQITLRTAGTVSDRIYSEMGPPVGPEAWATYMEGDWIPNGRQTGIRLRFRGNHLQQYSDGELQLEREVRWQTGCEGSASRRSAFVTLDPDTGEVERCTLLRYRAVEHIIFIDADDEANEQGYTVPNFPL